MLPGVLYLLIVTTVTVSVALDNSPNIVVDLGDEDLHHLQKISYQSKENHEELLIRGRRQINNKDYNLWPKAVVPYLMYQEETINKKREYIKAMWVFEANTCLRFVPWNETVGKSYGLGHDGHLNFHQRKGCYVVYTSVRRHKDGQPVSCCENEICIHELGHSLGMAHYQGSILRDGWLRINTKDIWPSELGDWTLNTGADYINLRFPFDMSTMMLYDSWVGAFGDGDWAETYLFPELRNVKSHYNQFRELALSYKCNQYSPCDGKELGCVNDGYTSIVYGKCQCACPEGLDPAALCAQPLRKVTMSWPKGQYSLPMPKTGCPGNEFQEMNVDFEKNAQETGDETPNNIQEFCSRNSTNDMFANHEEEKWNWPLGNYCIYKVGDKCPFGFTSGSVYTGPGSADSSTGQQPITQVDGSVTISFCCQYRGFTWNPSYLPTDQPFSVIKLTGSCQTITGMKFEQEVIKYFGKGFKTDGVVPQLDISDTDVSMTICQYTKTDMNCGDGIVLDSNNRETSFEYSGAGKTDVECTWVVRGDTESGTLVLDFEEMNIKKDGDKCVDRLAVRHALIGQVGLDHCGQSIGHSIRSITNKMVVRFFTKGTSDSSFKAKVKWIPNEDLCYDTYDRGISYNGQVNYTRLFEPCLPWAQVGECYHSPFMEGERRDSLDGNYCRNPDNSFRPWCYTDLYYCRRNYCDVCGLETPYDKVDDCDSLKEAGYCNQDAQFAANYCPNTCKEYLSPSNKNITKYGEIKCGSPKPPSDGKIIDQVKYSYNVGERIRYQCKTSSSITFSTCMTSSYWSPVPYACPDCPIGSGTYKESCYVPYEGKEVNDYDRAIDICKQMNGTLAAPRNTLENIAVLSPFKGATTWIGVTDRENEGKWVYEDGSQITWNSWKRGEPNDWYGEDCVVMDGNGDWNDIDCNGNNAKVVCKVDKAHINECYDFVGDRCGSLMGNNSNMCLEFPEYARQFCRKTCGLCDGNQGECSIEISDINVEIVNPAVSDGSIAVGGKVIYGCKKYSYKHGGVEVRSCLPSGKLTGEPLRCGDCPLGFKSGDTACHGLIPGLSLNFEEAKEECGKVGGYIAMPKSHAEEKIVSSAGIGETIWLGMTFDNNIGNYLWEDESAVYWKGGKNNKTSDSKDCIVLDGNKKWTDSKCDSKANIVCTVPKLDNYACYDLTDKGATYDGTVNLTITNTPCLPWTETTQCNRHALEVTNTFHTLEHNYCRNPDNAKRPWCYTSLCHLEYCDICKSQDSKQDAAIDCGIQRDNGVCTKDVTKATNECAGTCSDLLPNTERVSYREVKCQQPKLPSDGVVIGKSRSEYHVGDVVSVKCNYNKFVITTTCLTSGDWSEAGLVCSQCPLGYELHNDVCYGRRDVILSFDHAVKECAEVGGSLPSPKSMDENEILSKLNSGKYLWISIKRALSSGPFVWQDGSKVEWTDWADGHPKGYLCTVVDDNGKWQTQPCDFLHPKLSLVCAVSKLQSKLQTCSDYLDRQCPRLLVEKPSVCKDNPMFAQQYCAKTCGLCTDGVSTCDLPTPSNGIISSIGSSSIAVGNYVKYECPKFKYPSLGNPERACQPDGTLTGSMVECENLCPAGAVVRDGICYKYMNNIVTFPKAREECKDLKGFVAFPTNEEENRFLVSINKGMIIWLGISDAVTENDFLLEDGRKLHWSNWKWPEPNDWQQGEDCVILDTDKSWNDRDCDSRFSFVCAMPLLRNDTCYDVMDKGATYDGEVNVTVAGDACVEWATATNCPYHPFKSGEEMDRLDGNYCRNPDDTFRPWCYTDAETCDKKYCDVCNTPTTQQATDYTQVKCKPPSLPEDGMLANDEQIKLHYKIGDAVNIVCKKNNTKVTTTTCLTSGHWSPAGLACEASSKFCKDLLMDTCVTSLEANLKMCQDFPDFAKGFCAKTCGICGANGVTCDISSERDPNFVTSSSMSSLEVGQTINYECNENLILEKGNSIRVCQSNGVLSGSQFVCKDVSKLDTVFVGASELFNGNKVTPHINVFFGDNDFYMIKIKGIIIAWEYYSQSSIETSFQVWRHVRDLQYQLVGQNILTVGQEGEQTYDVPAGQRIKVQPGDLIGMMNSAEGGVKFNDCGDDTQNPAWGKLRWSGKQSSLSSLSTDDVIDFNAGPTACVVFPLKAIVGIVQ